MNDDRPDLIAYLQEEVNYLQRRLTQAQAALRAAKQSDQHLDKPKFTRNVADYPVGTQWSKEVDRIFSLIGKNQTLSVDEVCQLITKSGIDANSQRARSNIQTAMARRVGITLERVRPGVYRRKPLILEKINQDNIGEHNNDSAVQSDLSAIIEFEDIKE